MFNYSFLPFAPTTPHHPSRPHLLPPFLSPLVIVHVSFIIVPANPSPFTPIIPTPLPSAHCQPVVNFGVLVIFCLLVHFVYIFFLERETLIYGSTYGCIRLLLLVCAITTDQTHNLDIAGQCSSQLSNQGYMARANIVNFF